MESAIGGDALTTVILGNCFELGLGCAPDPGRAQEWYRRAANAGEDIARDLALQRLEALSRGHAGEIEMSVIAQLCGVWVRQRGP